MGAGGVAPSAGTCNATLTPKTNITPGQNINFTVSVVDDKGGPLTPQNETWLYNSGVFKNGNVQWDGNAALVEYQYTCPLNGQRLSTSYSIPSQDDGSGWIVVVGIGAAGVAAVISVAAGAVLIASGPKKNVKPGKQPQPPKYILQLSAVNLKVKPGQQAPLNITAWRIAPNGSPVAAPEAAIQVSVPPSPAGLVVSPGMGQGSLNCAFSIPKPTICAELMVTVISTAAGATARAQVKVSIVPVYELKLEWNGTPPGLLQPGSPEVYARGQFKRPASTRRANYAGCAGRENFPGGARPQQRQDQASMCAAFSKGAISATRLIMDSRNGTTTGPGNIPPAGQPQPGSRLSGG